VRLVLEVALSDKLMFKPTRIFLVKTPLMDAHLLSASASAFGNVSLNGLVLTSAALHGGSNYGGSGNDEAGDGGD
jgi:hypothetical protein